MRAVLIFLLGIPALAQFSPLATTTDGSQIYFSSPLELKGSADTSSDAKIFRYDGTNLYLYAHVPKVSFNPPPHGPAEAVVDSNYYSLQSPFVSGDGAVTGFVGYADCLGCNYSPAQTTFQFAGAIGELGLPYACDMSTNGRYALCLTRFTPVSPWPAVLIDLSSLQQSPPMGTLCWGNPHFMTSGGSVLLSSANSLTLWSGGSGSQNVGLARPGYCPMISNDGSVIVHVTDTELGIFDLATQTDMPLFAGPVINGTPYPSSLVNISDDARWILVTIFDGARAQLAIVDSTTGSMKQLTSGADGIQTATISGDGAVAYAVTASGTLLKIDTLSGASQVISGRQPVVKSIDGAPVPGSLNRLLGTGLADAQVTLNGAAIPIVAANATEVDVQIPWETQVAAAGDSSGATANVTLQIMPAAPTAFQQLWPLRIQAFAPLVETQPIHQDFSGFINPSSPAVGGEVVNYYFTGLGPVSPSVADGNLAGTNPLSLVTSPLTLVTGAGQAPATIVYAGLAPGTVGLYQVSIQLPAKINRTNPFLPGGPNNFFLTLNGIDLFVWALPN